MKQLLQRLDTGETSLIDVPVPRASGNTVVVESRATVVSAGTERMLVQFGKSNLLQKARSQPERVRQVLDKVRTDGLVPTIEAVRSKLEQPIPLGYCHAGVVVEAGRGAAFAPGDRVVTNGSHAEYVRVPSNLAARVPDGVSFESAAFTPVAAIGLQGIRLAAPTLGETVVVFGLGLIGLLTVQLLVANGCRVIGIDRAPDRLALAERFGADTIDSGQVDPVARVLALTGGVGADAVLLTLASHEDEPVHQAAMMSRKRGRIVLVGVTGLNLSRDDFYKKELSFAVSCSYGPGRYDPAYEESGQDYPLAYVRWTEQRNFDAVLAMMARGAVDPLPLVTHRIDFDEAPSAYDLITGGQPSLGVVLVYPDRGGAPPAPADRIVERTAAGRSGTVSVGVLGAGNFATRTLLPAFAGEAVRLRAIVASASPNAAVAAARFGFERVCSDTEAVIQDEQVDAVFVLTRHDSHARLAARALRAGKHVFVEKPLALDDAELDELEQAAAASAGLLMVGFNRRFAPLAREAAALLAARSGPASIIMTVNAGAIPREHWTQDRVVGGGRIVGEACHFLDLSRYLVGRPIVEVHVTTAHDATGRPVEDVAHLTVQFADGSTAVVHYLSNGARSFPKERIDCFFDGRTIVIDNWRRLDRFGIAGPRFNRSRRMDKGHAAEIHAWIAALRGETAAPIPLGELFEVSRFAIRAAEAARGVDASSERAPRHPAFPGL